MFYTLFWFDGFSFCFTSLISALNKPEMWTVRGLDSAFIEFDLVWYVICSVVLYIFNCEEEQVSWTRICLIAHNFPSFINYVKLLKDRFNVSVSVLSAQGKLESNHTHSCLCYDFICTLNYKCQHHVTQKQKQDGKGGIGAPHTEEIWLVPPTYPCKHCNFNNNWTF